MSTLSIVYIEEFLFNACYIGCGEHGKCIGPNKCACEIGWRGIKCDECIPLPGCVNGKCLKNPFECVCDDPALWSGALCNSGKTNFSLR